jgi:hypothetical protein
LPEVEDVGPYGNTEDQNIRIHKGEVSEFHKTAFRILTQLCPRLSDVTPAVNKKDSERLWNASAESLSN